MKFQSPIDRHSKLLKVHNRKACHPNHFLFVMGLSAKHKNELFFKMFER